MSRPVINGVTVIDHTRPAASDGSFPIINPKRQTFRRERAPQGTDPELARIIQALQENLHDVTQGVQGLPESTGRTYRKGVTFTSGVPNTLVHHLAVTSASQVGFRVMNQKIAAGLCYASAVTDRTVTLVPNATFTADVEFYVVP